MASCCSLLSLFFFAYFQIGGQTCHVISSYKSLLSQSTLSLWQPSTRTWSLQPLFAWHSYGTLSCNISVIHICPALLVPWTSTLHTTFTKLLINIAKIARNSLFVQLMQMSSIFDQSVLEPVYMQTLSVLVKKYDTMWLQTVKIQKNRQFNIRITFFFFWLLLHLPPSHPIHGILHTNRLHVLLHCNHESSM